MAITSAKTKRFVKRNQESKNKEYVVYYFLASAARKGPDTVPLKTTRVTAPSKLDAYLKASTPARVTYLVETVAAAERRRKPLVSVDRETYGQYLPIPLPETVEREERDPETKLYQQGGVISIDDYLLMLADAAGFEKLRGTVAVLVQEPEAAATAPVTPAESQATEHPPADAPQAAPVPEPAPPPADVVPDAGIAAPEAAEEKPEEGYEDEDEHDDGDEYEDDDSYEAEESEEEGPDEDDTEIVRIDLTEDAETEDREKKWITVALVVVMYLLTAYCGYIFGYDAGIAHSVHAVAHPK